MNTVSLKELMLTGVFAGLLPGISRQEVLRRLGEPDTVGGTSRKHKTPTVYLYGSVEIYVVKARSHHYMGAFWDAHGKGEFRFSSRYLLADWDLQPGDSLAKVETCIQELGLAFERWPQETSEIVYLRVLPGGAQIAVSKSEGLCSISTTGR